MHALSIIPVAVATLLSLWAVLRLRRRGRAIEGGQLTALVVALVAMFAALVGPLAHWAEHSLAAHMAQHLLLADCAMPLLLVGLRTPVLVFLWPRRIMSAVARMGWLRRLASLLIRPQVSLPLWLLTMYVWHVPAVFSAAAQNEWAHVVQHVSFWLASGLFWWPILQPADPSMHRTLWKAAYVTGGRIAVSGIGLLMIGVPRTLYDPYAHGAPLIDPLLDQQIAGSLMMGIDFAFIVWSLIWFGVRAQEPSGSR